MFSFFSQRMDSDQGGELGDVIRGSNGYGGPPETMATTDWKFLPLPECVSFPSSTEVSSSCGFFGDPFSDSGRDPLLDELPVPNCSDSSNGQFVKTGIKVGINGQVDYGSGTSTSALVATDQKMERFVQFSPTSRASPVLTRGLIRPPPIVVDGHVMKMMNSNSISSFLSDHNNLQISSPPRTLGIKRRKSQAKKVVCIPAPAAAGSRPSGEVVPSDFWAWRKYGQKPIKGSPYPRGYYRCSSSKGCSARKQVERSRTDPNMLVITYTSEHNHPWPTQRNVLAGSTRSQPTKTSTSASKISHQDQKDGQHTKEMAIDSTAQVKEEEEAVEMEIKEPILDNDLDQDVVFSRNYKPMFEELYDSDDIFVDLGEFQPDPMDLVYIPKGLLNEMPEEQEESQNGNKGVDPFSLFDWPEDTIEESKDVGLE